MKEFYTRFIEDTIDALVNLETDLLELEKNPEQKDLIDNVFRLMHSIKGASAMFGFDKIQELTHLMENLYNKIRDGETKVTKIILTVTLHAVDLLKNLLHDIEFKDKKNKDKYVEIWEELNNLVDKDPFDIDTDNLSQNDAVPSKNAVKNERTFYIWFIPSPEILLRGVKLLPVFEELISIGQINSTIHVGKIPVFDGEYDPVTNYVAWEIYIATSESQETVEDAFLFADEEYEIIEVFDKNIMKQENFENIKTDNNRKFKMSYYKVYDPESEDAETETINDAEQDNLYVEQKTSSIRVNSVKLDELMNIVSELVTTKAELSLIAEQLNIQSLLGVSEKIEKLSRQLRDNALNIRLVPIETILVRFKRLVRDLSDELGKEIELMIEGADTELDKTIIDNLSNPLMHILRNSIDHGIESPEKRIAKGKNRVGKIRLISYYSGTNVFIQIQDDGAGINIKKVKSKAIEKGLISPQANLSNKELLALIFLPGFSTTTTVSEVSGRGVGMNVVKERITDMRGDIEIDTEIDLGTSITLKLPLTLSIIDSLRIRIENIHVLIPLSVVDKCNDTEMNTAKNLMNSRLVIDGELIPIINLKQEFELDTKRTGTEKIVVVNYEGKRIGLIVDDVVGEYQAVLKPLGEIFRCQEIVSGACILGDGGVALVLDTNKLINNYQSTIKK